MNHFQVSSIDILWTYKISYYYYYYYYYYYTCPLHFSLIWLVRITGFLGFARRPEF
jgi:hypothetical protein